ncbi:MAG: aldehyde dehydrogenase family protein, partial [Chitinophagaceae bacterium]|nr:aldehyde dehydrogenase family protein [Chitinophagaceae bacterium]
MSFGTFYYPMPANEPVKSYAPGSAEKDAQLKVLAELKKKEIDIPQYIGGRAVRSGDKRPIHPPHERAHLLGYYHAGEAKHVQMAIDAALKAKPNWEAMPWEDRAAIFLKAADLIA